MGNYFDNYFSLQGKVALVTGGGRGIGLGVARCMAGAGADVILVSRTESQLAAAKETIAAESGVRVETIAADLSDMQAVAQVAAEAESVFGKIDILVNNAGSNIRKPFLEVTEDDYETVHRIQLKSVFTMTQHVIRGMVSRKEGGKVINIASLTSEIGIKNISIYGAAKAGIVGLTKSLAVEFAEHKINVNAIGPGYYRTAMTEAAFADPDRKAWMLSRIPRGRFGDPMDIGHAAVYLAAPAGEYVTGQVMYIDGGWLSA
jgi:NAD(P)-dependent dehydrogenase (short-subunit alcohol dehydrogenase family)